MVTLSPGDMCLGAMVGGVRQAANLHKERSNLYGAEASDPTAIHVLGARGEIVVSRAFNLYWSGALDFSAPDVGGWIDVRSRSRDHWDLILHDKDPDRPVVLVLAQEKPDQFRLAGWLMASDGKQQKYVQTPRPGGTAYFVPQAALRPLEELDR
jgi:hypothetical protein